MMGPFSRKAQGTPMREGMRQTHQQCCCAAPAAAGSGVQDQNEAGWTEQFRPFGALKALTEAERTLLKFA